MALLFPIIIGLSMKINDNPTKDPIIFASVVSCFKDLNYKKRKAISKKIFT